MLFSDDVEGHAAFYHQIGFTERFRVPLEGTPIHIDLEMDAYAIGIASIGSTRDDHGLEPVEHGQRAAVILWTDDAHSAFRELLELGCPTLAHPHVWLDRLLIAWVADPEGYPIQIVQHLDPRTP